MNKKVFIISLFCLLLSVNFLYAQEFGDVTQCADTTSGLTISVSHPVIAKIGEDVTFSMFVYDSNGKKKTASDTTCTIGLGGSQGEPRGLINESDITIVPSPIDAWTGTFKGGNFTETSNFAFIVRCEITQSGGCFEAHFQVTPNGKILSTAQANSYIGFIFIILFTFLLTLYGAIKVEWKHPRNSLNQIISVNNFRYLKVFLFCMNYVLMMFMFGLSYKFFNEADIQGFTSFFNYGYMIFERLLIPVMFGMIITFFIIFITNLKIKTNLDLGIK